MELLLLIGVLLLNVLISVWNCYAVGTAWKDVKAVGSWFDKLLLYSAVVQSGVGFSMPILLGLSYLTVNYMTTGETPTLTPAEAAQFMQGVFSLWYVAIVFPLLGSGFVIWAHSIRAAMLRKDFTSFAVAGWNTYAQISNTLSVFNNLGGALANVGDLFGGTWRGSGSVQSKLAITAFLLVVISLILGFMIAFGLVRYFSRRSESRLEQYGQTLQRS